MFQPVLFEDLHRCGYGQAGVGEVGFGNKGEEDYLDLRVEHDVLGVFGVEQLADHGVGEQEVFQLCDLLLGEGVEVGEE